MSANELALLLTMAVSVIIIIYIYMGYPLVAAIMGYILRRDVKKNQNYVPTVSIIIAAYNEESFIAETLENKLGLDYPKEKREIIVVSDCSSDKTDEIAESFKTRGVKLLRQQKRGGKTLAINRAVREAQGEILVFSDANSIHASDSIKKLVANFNDSSVGYVTGKMIYVNEDGRPIGDGCSTYMKYENLLRRQETRIGSVVGVDGGVDAMRKELYIPMRADQLPDFVEPLQVVKQGFRVVYEPEAILNEYSLKESDDEYRMRVRVALRAFWGLLDMRQLLSPFGNLIFAWQLLSHKILRYMTFLFMIAAYVANAFLTPYGAVYTALFVFQSLLYLTYFVTPAAEKLGIRSPLLNFPYYFILINKASMQAFIKFLRGRRMVTWQPRKG